MRPALMISFVLAIVILASGEILTQKRIPRPSKFAHAIWVWFILGILSDLGMADLAAVFGIGVVIAMAYTYFQGKNVFLETPSEDLPTERPEVHQ